MKRLFIVSNRLPVNVTETNKELEVNTSNGGLVTAISSYLFENDNSKRGEFNEVYWVGVPGCTAATWARAEPQIESAGYTYLPVFISKKIYDGYYNRLANSVIWPLFHYFPSFAEFDGNYYDSFIEANRIFMETLLAQVHPGDTIWIHDYHLMPLAGMIRKECPSVNIGFFLHIPFPSFEIFRIMPKRWQEDIIHGLLGADIIGFHTIDYATHFLKSAQMILGLDDDMHLVRYQDRLVKVDVFPISIDYNKFHEAYDKPAVTSARLKFQKQFENKKVIFSADRLDYTKGVFSRLKAYEHFLEVNPEYNEQVVFVLIVVPSRDNISRYAERKKMIDEYIGDINSRVGNINWQPVIYQYANLDFADLVAMYTACHLALITPLRDGMNLVSKEFVASRKDQQGVLVLSEMAGAAKELTDALIINPNDHEDIACKIKQGLEMRPEEQAKRLQTMQRRIALYDVRTWAEDFMKQLRAIKTKQTKYEVNFLDHIGRIDIMDTYSSAGNRLILLDYDGTLVPFSSIPSEASPGADLVDIIKNLSNDPNNEVYIVSGRDSHTLEQWLGHLQVNIVAEHGAKFRKVGGKWADQVSSDQTWKGQVEEIMNDYVQRCANSFIEKKDYSIAWHFRNANTQQAKLRSAELYSELLDYSKHQDLNMIQGNKVIEVRNQGVDKGSAVKKILSQKDYDFIIAFGDDTADEDMFRALPDTPYAYSVKVGDKASFARFNLHTPYMVVSMLEQFSNCVGKRVVEVEAN